MVEMAVRTGLALGCAVKGKSVWARKNYFYPDLPKGYQISQYELPLNERGQLSIEVEGKTRDIGVAGAERSRPSPHGPVTRTSLA